ncbi:MAG: putative capsid protein [Cressdnaviricota sp.]|nr:MAG: putative capsid protein [Cressdnaviricota sp.]
MSFCDIRITTEKILGDLSENTSQDQQNYAMRFLYRTSEYLDAQDYVMGEEKTNKFGEPTHQHYHINFYTEKEIKKDSVQKWIRNTFNLKGKEQYCVRVHIDLEDRNRWWRYPMKEKLIIHSKGLEDALMGTTVKQLKMLAKDEKKRQIEQNLKTRQNLMDKNAFRDNMFRHFKDEYKDNIPEDKKLWCDMSMYYIRHSKTPPFGKLDDTVVDFKVSVGAITIEEVYEIKHRGR